MATESAPPILFPFPPATEPAAEESKRSTREQLIAAAAEVFGESGYDGVSIRDVERRAGVNRGLVAHYFGTKEALWHAMVDWLMREFAGELSRYNDLLRMVSVEERPRIFMKVYVHFMQKHPQYFRLMMLEGDKGTERGRLLIERYARPLEEFWERATGVDPNASAQSNAIRHFILFGAGSGPFASPEYCRHMFGFDPRDQGFADRYADVIAEMWLRVREIVETDAPEA